MANGVQTAPNIIPRVASTNANGKNKIELEEKINANTNA